MIETRVEAGICGFQSVIKADSTDNQTVDISFETECPNLKPLEKSPVKIDAYEDVFGSIGSTESFLLCRPYCKHAACPVPTAVLKSVEAAAGLALPKDVRITMRKSG